MAEKSKRSAVPGGAEDEVIEGAKDPTVSSRDKDALFADAPRDSKPEDSKPIPASDTTPPERHDNGGPYDEDAAEATFFQARYDVDMTREEDAK